MFIYWVKVVLLVVYQTFFRLFLAFRSYRLNGCSPSLPVPAVPTVNGRPLIIFDVESKGRSGGSK